MSADVIDLADFRPGWIVVREVCYACGGTAIGVVHVDGPERFECGLCGEWAAEAERCFVEFNNGGPSGREGESR